VTIVVAALAASLVVGSTRGTPDRHRRDGPPPKQRPAAPAPSTTTTVSLTASVESWWTTVRAGYYQFGADLRAVSTDVGSDDPSSASDLCATTLSVIHQLQGDPAAPDPTINTPWQAALTDYADSVQTCQTWLGSTSIAALNAMTQDSLNGDSKFMTAMAVLRSVIGPSPTAPILGASSDVRILSVTDLPTNWTATARPSPGGYLSSRCTSGLNRTARGTTEAHAVFTTNGARLSELLATGAHASSRLSKVEEKLTRCRSLTTPLGDRVLTTTIRRLAFPDMGAASKAYALSASVTGVTIGGDLFLFRTGDYVGALEYVTKGTPRIATAEAFATEAVSKAQGNPFTLPN
jgi:hypothetical protein